MERLRERNVLDQIEQELGDDSEHDHFDGEINERGDHGRLRFVGFG
jgi:hypothetical protein